MKLAIFDFDGTIYKNETFTLLMSHLKESYPKQYRRFFTVILPIYIGYKIKLIPERKMKTNMMQHYVQALQHLSETEINHFFATAARKMVGDFNPKVVERMKDHKKAGFYTMIVSGAFTPLLQAINESYGMDKLIGTEIPDAQVAIDHVHAERKTTLIHELLQEHTVNWDESYAYGDSAADLSVLELVGHPIAVRPDDVLESIATERNWEIID